MGPPNCDACKNLDSSRFETLEEPEFPSGKVTRVYPKAYRLKADRVMIGRGARGGCSTCKIVQSAYQSIQRSTSRPDFIDIYKYKDEITSIELSPSCKMDFCTMPGTDGSRDSPGIGSRVKIPHESLSDMSLGIAATWLRDCLDNHPGCGNVEETLLPTRSIKVGNPGDDPQLVVTEGMPGRYATLSHCWGDKDGPLPLTTTKSTVTRRLAGIKFQDLPRTFQDAVTVTRRLGLEYLWIDSLCIIQQDIEDWALESKRMQDVYANADLNISADAARNSSEGLDRTLDINPGLELDDFGSIWAWTGRGRPELDSYGLSHSPCEVIPEHPLHARAWVLQERMLSRRILHFCTSELAWECTTYARCECTAEPRAPPTEGHRGLFYAHDVEMLAMPAWNAIIRRYSSLGLTAQSDKAIAIAGVAMLAARNWPIIYVSGLWEEHLPYCLLWYSQTPGERTTDQYTSWSWTSISTLVEYDSYITFSVSGPLILSSWHECHNGHLQDKRLLQIQGLLVEIKSWSRGRRHLKYYRDVMGSADLKELHNSDCHFLAVACNWQSLNLYGLLLSGTYACTNQRGCRAFRRIGYWQTGIQDALRKGPAKSDVKTVEQYISRLGFKKETILLL